MYLIYQFFPTYTSSLPGSSAQTNVWVISAECTTLIDAQTQQTRFIALGISANYLELLMDSQPPPTAIPLT